MEYIFEYSKLRGRIREICGTEGRWAEEMGFSGFTSTMKLNGKSYFKSDEIIRCCEILAIPTKDIGEYFFTLKQAEHPYMR